MNSNYLPTEFSYLEPEMKQLVKAIVAAQQYEDVIVYNWAGEIYESIVTEIEGLGDDDYEKVISVVDDLLPLEWCFWMAEADAITLALAGREANPVIH